MPSLSPVHENTFPSLTDLDEHMYEDQIMLGNQWGTNGMSNMNPTYTTLQPMSRLSHQNSDQLNTINQNRMFSSKSTPSNMNILKHELNIPIKHPKNWESTDIVSWLFQFASKYNINYELINMENFNNITGYELINMNCNEFLSRDPRLGEMIYKDFQTLLHSGTGINGHYETVNIKLEPELYPSPAYEENSTPVAALYWGGEKRTQQMLILANNLSITSDLTRYYPNEKFSENELDVYLNGVQQHNTEANNRTGSLVSPLRKSYHLWTAPEHVESDPESDKSSHDNLHSRRDSECSFSSTDSPTPQPTKRGPGRPPNKERQQRHRNKHGSKGNHLWEFIRDILKNPKYCPKIVKWENKEEGVFRFVESEAVAKMWGNKKCNPRMTYEKLSRAMRTYYNNQILVPVPKTGKYPKKLVYKFGPKSHGWMD